MSDHGINGTLEYSPDYSCTEEDYEAAKAIYDGAGVEVSHVSPVADLQFESGRAVLIRARRRKPMDILESAMCVLFIAHSGTKYYCDAGDTEVPKNQEEFANSFLDLTTGSELVRKRANLWSLVHRISNQREEIADHVSGEPIIEVIDEEEQADGSLELDIKYDERLENVVARYYDVEEADEERVKDFILDALKERLNQNV